MEMLQISTRTRQHGPDFERLPRTTPKFRVSSRKKSRAGHMCMSIIEDTSLPFDVGLALVRMAGNPRGLLKMLKIHIVFASAAVLGVFPGRGVSAQASGSLEQTRDSLRSSNPVVRARAFYRLEVGQYTALPGDLLALLETENALIYAVNRMGTSPSDSLGEGWGEYYAEVRGACQRYCDHSSPNYYAALVDGAYNEDNADIRELARDHGPAILNRLLERSMSDVSVMRAKAVRMLGVVAEFRQQFTAAQKGSIRRAVLRAVEDRSYPIREAGIFAMGTVGDTGDLPLLQRIAATDPNRVTTRTGRGAYPLREEAQRAVRRIGERASPPR